MYLKKIFILFFILLISLLLISACTANQEQGEDLSPLLEEPEKGNPKLDSHLNQLIRAERQGEAESFARQSDIELVDGNVRVEIECLPDQVDAAAKEARALGTVEIISRRLNGVQAVVPITSLTTLAEAESIRFIRLPWYPEEEAE